MALPRVAHHNGSYSPGVETVQVNFVRPGVPAWADFSGWARLGTRCRFLTPPRPPSC